MPKIFIVLFREAIEISFIIGVIMTATYKIPKSKKLVSIGALIGGVLSFILGYLVTYFGQAWNPEDKIFAEAFAMLVTILMIGWTVIWMEKNSNNMYKKIKDMESDIEKKFTSGSIIILITASLIFREGVEIMLYLYGILSSYSLAYSDVIKASLLGSILGAIVGGALFKGLLEIAGKKLFKVISLIFTFIAASISTDFADSISELGFFKKLSLEIWDTSFILPEESIIGDILKSLVGYVAKPTALQVIFYAITFITIYVLARTLPRRQKIND